MLSDEEKTAIKELTEIKELFEEDLKENYEVTAILDQIDLESLVIALNLIEKQSKEIEELNYIKRCFDYCVEQKNKKWEDKIKAKTIEIKNRPVKDEFITASQGKLNAIIDMESLLEKE